MELTLLVDCNNFFVSCERVFDPSLVNVPVGILSNNDGCFIARSNEVKAIGIPMAAPLFKYQHLVNQYHVRIRSCNFALYADMSKRVFEELSSFQFPVEIYSVDEAFVILKDAQKYTYENLLELGHHVRNHIYKTTGIPVSCGIAKTKTLAKIATKKAKKLLGNNNVYVMVDDCDLSSVPIDSVWGIGYRWAQKLKSYRIFTAEDLKQADDAWIKKCMSVIGLKTAYELRGNPCVDTMSLETQKSISRTRTLAHPISDEDEILTILMRFTTKLMRKIRKKKQTVEWVSIFLKTNRFEKDYQTYTTFRTLQLATADTLAILPHIRAMVSEIFSPNAQVKRIGVIMAGLGSSQTVQTSFFEKGRDKTDLMQTIDAIHKKFPYEAIRFGCEGKIPPKSLHFKQSKSPNYTTRWSDVLVINI